MPPRPVLHLELLFLVVQHLEGERRTLLNLAVTCKALSKEAHAVLYSFVSFMEAGTPIKHIQFLRTILRRPELGRLVKSYEAIWPCPTSTPDKYVHCICESSKVARVMHGIPGRTCYTPGRVPNHQLDVWPHLPAAMTRMTNLRILALSLAGPTHKPAQEFRKVAETLARCPFRLSSFEWHDSIDVTSVVTILRPQTELKHLTIYLCHEAYPIPVDGYSDVPSIRDLCPELQSLKGNRATLDAFCPGRSVQTLSYLPSVCDGDGPTLFSEPIAEKLRANLRHLVLAYITAPAHPPLHTLIPYLSRLEVLELMGFKYDYPLELLSQLRHLHTLILTPSRTQLRDEQFASEVMLHFNIPVPPEPQPQSLAPLVPFPPSDYVERIFRRIPQLQCLAYPSALAVYKWFNRWRREPMMLEGTSGCSDAHATAAAPAAGPSCAKATARSIKLKLDRVAWSEIHLPWVEQGMQFGVYDTEVTH